MIKNEITIQMERLTDKNVTGYEVLAVNPMTARQQCIAVIDNPQEENPIKIKRTLKESKAANRDPFTRIVDIPHSSVIINQKYGITLYINGEVVPIEMYLFNRSGSYIIIYIATNELDVIEAEYYIDGMEFSFTTEGTYQYSVKPIIDEENVLIGRHTKLI